MNYKDWKCFWWYTSQVIQRYFGNSCKLFLARSTHKFKLCFRVSFVSRRTKTTGFIYSLSSKTYFSISIPELYREIEYKITRAEIVDSLSQTTLASRNYRCSPKASKKCRFWFEIQQNCVFLKYINAKFI